MIQGKITPPGRRQQSVPRPRVVKLLLEPLLQGRHVTVTASAGSGKTTAVLEAMDQLDVPAGWLAVDVADRAPGRLLTYLQAAIRRAVEVPAVVDEALANGLPHAEAAGVLAEALTGSRLVLVVDNTERIADSGEACELLSTFIRYLPASVCVVLVGRLDLPIAVVGSAPATSLPGPARVGDRDLAFRPDEAKDVLASLGRNDIDAEEAVAATGGWITGIMFELWRYAEHVHGAGGEADPLWGYLSVEIMSALTPAQRRFLIATSTLDEVTPARAEALGLADAGRTLDALAALHLPVEFAPVSLVMRCHPRFREYLHEQLEHADPGWLRSIRRAHGCLLRTERRYEEAVDELLRAIDADTAAAVIEDAAPGVLDRLDFDVVAGWLDALGPVAVQRSPRLIAAAIRVLCEREEYGEGARYADLLLSYPALRSADMLTPQLVSIIAWCYFLVSRIEDAQALLATAPDSPDRRLMRYAIGLELIDDPTHYRDRPPECGGPADGLLARCDVGHGRFRRVLTNQSLPWAAVTSSRVNAAAAMGDAETALTLLAVDRAKHWTSVRIRAELMADLGQPEQAWTALIQGRNLLSRSGSNLYRMFALLLEASLALRHRRDTSFAAAALNEVEREPSALRRIRVVEQLHLWRGLAALIDDDAAAAAHHLREAVALMVRWDRLLHLPTAATYLAEAEWRLDNVDAADRAADTALQAAGRQGSVHLLIQALREFPAVVSRRLDAETAADSEWHELGRAVLAPARVGQSPGRAQVHLIEFGDHQLIANGLPVQPKLGKSLELLSYLAAHDGTVSRADALRDLFVSSSDDSAGAYFRMALNGLRKVLPADAALSSESGMLSWRGSGLSSESGQVEGVVGRLPHLPRDRRIQVINETLASLERGDFLPTCRSEWVMARRRRFEVLGIDLREAGAETAYAEGEYRTADAWAWQVLDKDAYRERSWRLVMKIAAALGDENRILMAYRGCVQALTEIGTEPAAATQALMAKLRGLPGTTPSSPPRR